MGIKSPLNSLLIFSVLPPTGLVSHLRIGVKLSKCQIRFCHSPFHNPPVIFHIIQSKPQVHPGWQAFQNTSALSLHSQAVSLLLKILLQPHWPLFSPCTGIFSLKGSWTCFSTFCTASILLPSRFAPYPCFSEAPLRPHPSTPYGLSSMFSLLARSSDRDGRDSVRVSPTHCAFPSARTQVPQIQECLSPASWYILSSCQKLDAP